VWDCPPTWVNVFDERYIEGDAWHYRWFVPGDPQGLVELFGSPEYFAEQLDYFFSNSADDPLNVLPDPYYWAGNEPDILAVYLFDFAGRPDLTQKYVRWLMDNKYTIESDGLPGNDDYGTMSAWYTFSAIGFYPLAGSPVYMIGSPIFPKVTIHRPLGDLIIIANNASPTNIYVQNATINGQPIDMKTPLIYHSQIQKQSTLEFWMTNVPVRP